MLEGKPKTEENTNKYDKDIEAHTRHIQGHDNSVFTGDDVPPYNNNLPVILTNNHLQKINGTDKAQIRESSRL